ncbi:hypothetical protein M2451_004166, partial [Dysgonomonas sp. PFB1-18]|nr:hypothetical protein [Dysgonomonas sp. PF1-14]MDH6341124.1 hypothetical protein [Dysgonomonas sp. PF1-16]MDH6382813.1 hypothetical protein [Dysgonomonas sp. PFB1-18]MDH6400095.1 hypothetical protein [Dysgonomonas sp. PF1-23]
CARQGSIRNILWQGLGKCSLKNLSSPGLSEREINRTGSVACREDHKSTSYQVATEWGDEKTDTRIKSGLIER